MHHLPRRAAAAGACVLLGSMHTGGCTAPEPGAAAVADGLPAEEWTLSAEPVVEIGVVEGEEHYQLHEAVSSVRLRDGRIVVLNAGSHELRFYDARGVFLRAVGSRGAGPGEFRAPARIHALNADTILVYDVGLGRESWFAADGTFVRAAPDPPTEEPWQRDAWLYGRNFIDGPRSPGARAPVRAALDRSTAPISGFRYIMVDARGRLWVRNGLANEALPTEWVVHRPDGTALATVTTPPGYEPQHLGDDFVLGRARDAMNVEYIRLYALTAAGTDGADPLRRHARTVGTAPAAVEAGPATDRAAAALPPAPVPEPLLARMRSVLRGLAIQQELFYANPQSGYRYAQRADQLEWPEDMTDLDVHILRGDARGWTALLFHRTHPVACGATTGVGGPIGWTPGVVVCQ